MKSMRGGTPTKGTPTKTKVDVGADPFPGDDLGLSFYGNAPNCEVSAREFEELTCQRLRMLHAIDRACTGAETFSTARVYEIMPQLRQELLGVGLLLEAPFGATKAASFPERKDDFVRRDAISHYALRLAFCKTRDAKEWLLKQEQRLFVLRFDHMTSDSQSAFFEASNVVNCKKFDFEQKDLPEKLKLKSLQDTTHGARIWSSQSGGQPEFDTKFYELAFGDVPPSLLSQRKVVLHKGNAYVPFSALKLILAARFKERLGAGLEAAFSGLPTALGNATVGPFLRLLQDHGMQLLVAPKANGDSEDLGELLSLHNFEELKLRSFPPCMRRVVELQRESKKHLKHAGRMQLRPFLKDCGFSFEDSIKWWQKELCNDASVDATSFEKNYMYDIDHAYGRKGHLQGQHCYGCPKIIDFPYEAAGQTHGCVFKHLEVPALRQLLQGWRIPEAQVGEIEKLVVNGKHYQLGCIEYFKAMHPGHEGDGVGNAPMQFFKESCKHHTKLTAEKAEKAEQPKKE